MTVPGNIPSGSTPFEIRGLHIPYFAAAAAQGSPGNISHQIEYRYNVVVSRIAESDLRLNNAERSRLQLPSGSSQHAGLRGIHSRTLQHFIELTDDHAVHLTAKPDAICKVQSLVSLHCGDRWSHVDGSHIPSADSKILEHFQNVAMYDADTARKMRVERDYDRDGFPIALIVGSAAVIKATLAAETVEDWRDQWMQSVWPYSPNA